MAMTLPYPTWNPLTVLTASQLTTYLNNNSLFLLNGKQIVEKKYRGGSSYTTPAGASGTSWNVVDTTNLSLGVSSSFITGRLWARAQFWARCDYTDGNATQATGYKLYFDLQLDGTTFLSTGTNTSSYGSVMLGHGSGGIIATGASSLVQLVTIEGWFTGLSTGAPHTVKILWKTNQNNTQGTLINNTEPQVYMMLKED